MRKFIYTMEMDKTTFDLVATIRERDENGVVSTLSTAVVKRPKYTPEQQIKIDAVNAALTAKNDAELTEEEIEFLLDPMRSSISLHLGAADLQRLAGFTVEKKIVYLDKQD